MTKHWVYVVSHSPVCQILLQIVVRAVITPSPPAWTSSAGMLSTPADFPFFNHFMNFMFLCSSATSTRHIFADGNGWNLTTQGVWFVVVVIAKKMKLSWAFYNSIILTAEPFWTYRGFRRHLRRGGLVYFKSHLKLISTVTRCIPRRRKR